MKSNSQKLQPINYPIPRDGVFARIRPILREDGSVDMTADLRYAGGVKHDFDIEARSSARSAADIDLVASQLAATIAKRYAERIRQDAATTRNAKPYTTAFDALNDEQKDALVPNARRSAKYRQQSLSEFRIFLKILDTYGLFIEESDFDAVVEARRAKAESNKNAIRDPETTTATTNASIKTFNTLYPALRAAQPDYQLPEIHLPLLLGGRGAKREQVKELPDDILVPLAMLISLMFGNGLALGTALMLVGMARTAEACAPRFKHFLIFNHFAVFGVLYQSNGRVQPINILKSNAAYRLVVVPKFGRDLIVATMDYLEKQGYTKAEILELPATSMPGRPEIAAKPSTLSAFVRNLLTLLGCEENFWTSVEKMIEREPDLDGFGKINRDLSAYVLRRNACTQFVNRCGMHPSLVDVLMGHELVKGEPTNWVGWVRMPDSWAVIAEQQERWVLDPSHSAHPALQAVALDAATDAQIQQATEAAFEATEDGEYIFAFAAPEANDTVSISLPSPGAVVVLPAISIGEAEYPPIIGTVPPTTFYARMRKKAESLVPLILSAEEESRP